MAVTTWLVIYAEDPLPGWANYSILGVIIIALITKQLVVGWQYSDVKNENVELRAEIKSLHEKQIDVYTKEVGALQAATDALNGNQDVMSKTKEALRDALAELRAYRGIAGGRE